MLQKDAKTKLLFSECTTQYTGSMYFNGCHLQAGSILRPTQCLMKGSVDKMVKNLLVVVYPPLLFSFKKINEEMRKTLDLNTI